MKTGEKNIHWRKGGKAAKKKAQNPQNRATTREFTIGQKTWSLSVKRELSSHVQKTFVFRLDNSEANQWSKPP